MKRGFSVVAVVLLAAAALYLFSSLKNPAPPGTPPSTPNFSANNPGNPAAANSPNAAAEVAPAAISNPPPPISSSPQPENLAARAGKMVTDANAAAKLPPETVMHNVRRAIHQYSEMFGGDPVGTNPEITSQLTGNNPKHLNFVTTQAGMRVNGDGELVDAWGTPYFFHQLSATDMEIHSAGPDKIMWTSDDLVVR